MGEVVWVQWFGGLGLFGALVGLTGWVRLVGLGEAKLQPSGSQLAPETWLTLGPILLHFVTAKKKKHKKKKQKKKRRMRRGQKEENKEHEER